MNEGQNLDVLGDWCVYDVVIVGACYLWRHYKQFKPRGICKGSLGHEGIRGLFTLGTARGE